MLMNFILFFILILKTICYDPCNYTFTLNSLSQLEITSAISTTSHLGFQFILFFTNTSEIFSVNVPNYNYIINYDLKPFQILAPITLTYRLYSVAYIYIAVVSGYNIYMLELEKISHISVNKIALIKVFKEHTNTINDLKEIYSRSILSADDDGKVVVWNYKKTFSVNGYVEKILQHEKPVKIINVLNLYGLDYCLTLTIDKKLNYWINGNLRKIIDLTQYNLTRIVDLKTIFLNIVIVDASGKIIWLNFLANETLCEQNTNKKILSVYFVELTQKFYLLLENGVINLWEFCNLSVYLYKKIVFLCWQNYSKKVCERLEVCRKHDIIFEESSSDENSDEQEDAGVENISMENSNVLFNKKNPRKKIKKYLNRMKEKIHNTTPEIEEK